MAQQKLMDEKKTSVFLTSRMSDEDKLLAKALIGLTGRLSLEGYVKEMGLSREPDGKGGFLLDESAVNSAIPHQNEAHLAVTSRVLDATRPIGLDGKPLAKWGKPPELEEHTYEAAIAYLKANPQEMEAWADYPREIGKILSDMRKYTVDVKTWIMGAQEAGDYE